GGELVHQDPEGSGQHLQPTGDRTLAVRLPRDHERGQLAGLRPHVDHVVVVDLVARDVHLLAVDQEVPVHHELARVTTGPGQAGAVHDVVQAALQQLEQDVTGLPGLSRRLLVVAGELLLENAVGVAGPLLLPQLQEVLALLGPSAAVLPRRVRTALEGLVAADQIGAEPARLLGDGSGVTGHGSTCSFGSDAATLRRAAAVVRHGGDVLDRAHLEAGGREGAYRSLAPGSRTADEHVDLLLAVLHGAPGRGLGGELRGERRRLPGTLEADRAGTGPRDHRTHGVGDRHHRVVERALDVSVSEG